MIWTARQQAGLVVLLLAVLVMLGGLRAIRTLTISEPAPANGVRSAELADRLDPNVATVGELCAIPELGEKRAEAIIAFRGNRARAFDSIDELQFIRGIGPATIERLSQYLSIPSAK